MRVSDVERGEPRTLEIRPIGGGGFGRAISLLDEADLVQSGSSDESLLKIAEEVWGVCGVDERHEANLESLVARNLPRLCWVVAALPRGSKDPQSLVIETRTFPSEHIWPGVTEVGVDEKAVDSMRQRRKSLATAGDVIAWLNDKFLIPDPSGGNRVLLSGAPAAKSGTGVAFRLYGKGVAVDVASDNDDRLLVSRVVEASRPIGNDERRPVLLARGQFRFEDHTVAGRFRGTARTILQEVAEEPDNYLRLWREYNTLERESILQRAKEFGWLHYSSRVPLPDGSWRFTLIGIEDLEANIRLLEEGESVELEAAETPPAELVEDFGDEPHPGETVRRTRVFAGECVRFDRRHGTVDLRPPLGQGEADASVPEKGVLFVSLSGDRKRLERRENARMQIASAECPMPQLGLLILGSPVPIRTSTYGLKGLYETARKAFGGEPTGRQIDALKIAIETPDIALIQGPPGTGKTRVIAALQQALADNRPGRAVPRKSLLSSYQHDAVENVANATVVFGLPAIKIGRKRGQAEQGDGFDRWRRERVEAVSAELSRVQETPLSVAFKRCRDLTVAYLRAPSRFEDVSGLLAQVREIASPHIPTAIADNLLYLEQTAVSRGTAGIENDLANELALKAVRGLRAEAVTFSDDGPIQALKALRRLESLGLLRDNEHQLLTQAAEWEDDAAPPFLPAVQTLQEDLIDRLLPDERPLRSPVVSVDVEAVLVSVTDALREKLRSTKGGIESVLYEYRDDLELDEHGAREAVERYTVVLAATCQQAVGYQMNTQRSDTGPFETVVVDEAARANPLDLFIPMSLAERRIVLVGDHRQLPHILDYEIEQALDQNVSQKTEELLHKSLFERLFVAMRERESIDGIKRTVTLDLQFRMHPVLGSFISDIFYSPHGEAFASGLDAGEFGHDLPRYGQAVGAWVDIPLGRGRESGRQSKQREVEARWIADEVHRILVHRPDFSVGVITFYAAQAQQLLRQMEGHGLAERMEDGSFRIAENWQETRDLSGRLKERLRVGTVDAFQGKEFDVVLLSMTRSNDVDPIDEKALRRKYGHLMLENRLCVAMSRQQRLLVVVGDAAMLQPEIARSAIPGLVKFHEFCGGDHGVQLHA